MAAVTSWLKRRAPRTGAGPGRTPDPRRDPEQGPAPGTDPAGPSRRSLRSRILATTLAITGAAVTAFGLPLGVALARIEHDRVVLRLEREASHVIAAIPDETLLRAGPLGLPTPIPGTRDADDRSMIIGVYAAGGGRLSGLGPATSRLAAVATATGREEVGTEAGQLVVALSLRADRPSGAAVRVAVGAGDVGEDQRASWLLMGALAAGILLLAGGAAFLLARRLTRPLEALARNAELLGEGDFTVRTRRTGLREIDSAGQALDTTARRLGALLHRERAFSSNASHQIRTPLAALRLSLETAPGATGQDGSPVLVEAFAQLDRLEATLDQLLALTRDVERIQAPIDLPALLAELDARWREPVRRAGRRLTVTGGEEAAELRGSAASLGHVLDVLVDNALVHGTGTIGVHARAAGGAVVIDVRDDGPGIAGDPAALFHRRSGAARGHGIGLALARSLVEADGGRLEVAAARPGAVFTVLLPVHRTEGTSAPTGNPS